jgi:GAF domain-containing protein
VLYAGSDVPAALPNSIAASEALKQLAAERQALATPDLTESPELLATDACPGVEAGPVRFAPVDSRDAQPAYLAVYRKRGRARYTANETELLLLLAAWLGVTLENLRRSKSGERLQVATATLRREVRRATRYGQELSVLHIRLDAPAHPEPPASPASDAASTNGDHPETAPHTAALRDVAGVLAKQIRSFDFIGRHGDAGLLVVLPQTGRAGAAELAERSRAAIDTTAFEPAVAGETTATIGVACYPQQGLEVEALIAVAERAVDQGQRAGGNRVSSAEIKAVRSPRAA